jgi:hypothetical protein
MRLLLDTGKVDIEAFDFECRTPLSHAAGAGKTEAVMVLLAAGGVNPNSMDWNGRTPLSWAAEFGYADVVKVLLATGKVAPDTFGEIGKTLLFWATGSSRYISNKSAIYMSQAEREMALEDIRRVLKGEAPLVLSIEATKRKKAPERLAKYNPLEVMERLLQHA